MLSIADYSEALLKEQRRFYYVTSSYSATVSYLEMESNLQLSILILPYQYYQMTIDIIFTHI